MLGIFSEKLFRFVLLDFLFVGVKEITAKAFAEFRESVNWRVRVDPVFLRVNVIEKFILVLLGWV